jgi:hypothetical protein
MGHKRSETSNKGCCTASFTVTTEVGIISVSLLVMFHSKTEVRTLLDLIRSIGWEFDK